MMGDPLVITVQDVQALTFAWFFVWGIIWLYFKIDDWRIKRRKKK